jgi:hypothetical protein
MTEEIRIGPKSAFATDAGRINYVLELRKDLIRTKPITDKQITKLDKWLLSQPGLLPLAVLMQIWTRAMWVTACDYEQEQDPVIKHLSLLYLRDHFDVVKPPR